MTFDENVSLGKLTTVGIGGPARRLARPKTLADLEQALAWAAGEGLPVVTIGLGSNLLIADEGVDALALRLDGELAAAATENGLLVAGGGAANAVCLHRARAAGLGGFEFACAIPGTVGGGVQMNAGAYGSDWAAILERALVVSVEGADWQLRAWEWPSGMCSFGQITSTPGSSPDRPMAPPLGETGPTAPVRRRSG